MSGRVFDFSAKGLGFDPLSSIPFLYELLSMQVQHLLSAAFAALIIHCKWSVHVYARLYSEALNKRLFSAPVDAEKFHKE